MIYSLGGSSKISVYLGWIFCLGEIQTKQALLRLQFHRLLSDMVLATSCPL